MRTKISVCITIKPRVNSQELYARLLPYGVNVTDLGDTVYAYTQVDIREDVIERILKICHEYGSCSVHTSSAEDSPSK